MTAFKLSSEAMESLAIACLKYIFAVYCRLNFPHDLSHIRTASGAAR
jgi:hypothetical protein